MNLRPLTRWICASLLLSSAAAADVASVVGQHIVPRYAAFADATADLAQAANRSCAAADVQPAFHAAFDAWMGIQHLHLGPVEDAGRGLAIQFWPDPKASGAKAQQALLAGPQDALTPAQFAQQSVAARGFMALERLLYPAKPWQGDTCALLRATTADLARNAAEILADWQGAFAAALITAGQPENNQFLSQTEAEQALFTQLATGLEALKDTRLGRPLGPPDRPAPQLAEARASQRSLRNVTIALHALKDFAQQLCANAPATQKAFERAITLAEALKDPIFDGVTNPSGRLKVEILAGQIGHVRDLALSELAPAMGVGIGFNAQDGD